MKILLLSFATLMFLAGFAQAETRALLIGVSDYDESIGLSNLRGPANDVALLKHVLENRGVSDITALTNDGPIATTRATILTAFGDLAATPNPAILSMSI